MSDGFRVRPDPADPSLWIVSRETSERLSIFETLLLRWNKRINLIGPNEGAQLRQRHIGDSLQLLSLLPAEGRIVDLGSGAGLPGLVAAIAGDRPATLIEADGRKASFLREAARATGADVVVIADRIEQSGVRDAEIVTARALAPLPRLLALAAPVMGPSAVAFFPKGETIDAELTAAGTKWQMTFTRHPSRIDPHGCILEVRHLHRVDGAPQRSPTDRDRDCEPEGRGG